MSNIEKYNEAFIEAFEIDKSALNDDLKYQSIKAWDSVGHMALIAALEDKFDLMLEMDDVVDFSSYAVGMKTLEKYGVQF